MTSKTRQISNKLHLSVLYATGNQLMEHLVLKLTYAYIHKYIYDIQICWCVWVVGTHGNFNHFAAKSFQKCGIVLNFRGGNN